MHHVNSKRFLSRWRHRQQWLKFVCQVNIPVKNWCGCIITVNTHIIIRYILLCKKTAFGIKHRAIHFRFNKIHVTNNEQTSPVFCISRLFSLCTLQKLDFVWRGQTQRHGWVVTPAPKKMYLEADRMPCCRTVITGSLEIAPQNWI